MIIALIVAATLARVPADSVQRAYRICGVDRSGSYDFVAAGLEACAQVILRAKPGDVVAVRWISDRSYATSELVVRVRLPESSRTSCASAFDSRCRAAALAEVRRLAGVKRQAAAIVRGAHAATSRRTDVEGFLAAASDFLMDAPGGARRVCYITGDLEGNVRAGVNPPLQGVEVFAIAQQTSASARRTAEARNAMRQRLGELGVVSVTFTSDMTTIP